MLYLFEDFTSAVILVGVFHSMAYSMIIVHFFGLFRKLDAVGRPLWNHSPVGSLPWMCSFAGETLGTVCDVRYVPLSDTSHGPLAFGPVWWRTHC